MYLFKRKVDLKKWVDEVRHKSQRVAFVPTMGALHEGHLSLFEKAFQTTGCVVGSIYINPTQFNDPKDYEKYPQTLGQDIVLLENSGFCQALYIPDTEDIYEDKTLFEIDLGFIGNTLEGAARPGHFKGVVNVVDRFFHAVNPDEVFFGQKDFQQCLVIQELIRQRFPQLIFHRVETKRELSGLAMSSRNIRLTESERILAEQIPIILSEAVNRSESFTPDEVKTWAESQFLYLGFMIDYLSIVHQRTLMPAQNWKEPSVIVFAGKLPSVRLIDNMLIPTKEN